MKVVVFGIIFILSLYWIYNCNNNYQCYSHYEYFKNRLLENYCTNYKIYGNFDFYKYKDHKVVKGLDVGDFYISIGIGAAFVIAEMISSLIKSLF